jgi:Abortive infection C-terminus
MPNLRSAAQRRYSDTLLGVFEDILAELVRAAERPIDDTDAFFHATKIAARRHAHEKADDLERLLRRDGYTFERGRLSSLSSIDLSDFAGTSKALDPETLREHIKRIEQSIDSDSGQAIGSAKELVESVAKAVLISYGDASEFDTLQKLVTAARERLNLTVDDIPESARGAGSMKQILAGLAQIVGGTAELRNLYGTGHGRTRRAGLTPRHARLVVGAAAMLARFLLETLEERQHAAANPNLAASASA